MKHPCCSMLFLDVRAQCFAHCHNTSTAAWGPKLPGSREKSLRHAAVCYSSRSILNCSCQGRPLLATCPKSSASTCSSESLCLASRRKGVQLHVAGPQVPVDLDLGVEEVGARVGVEQSRVDHTHLEPVVGHHVAVAVQAVLPYVLHEFFHNANLVISCCSGMC